jgi:adenylate cyclase
MTQTVDRRLAAILVADIAGYSALMGADEEATVEALKGHQSAILPVIGTYDGRVIDLAGDGILAEFRSALGAVKAALSLQDIMRTRNSEVPPSRQLLFRVGINQGDVVHDGDRIYGEGINVAARIQALAKPGGICVSGKVYDEVRDRVDTGFADMGERELKNIARKVRVYAMGGDADPPADTRPISTPSLAVLPFQNMSGDLEQDYFADGIVEDIITALSRFKSFAVVARNSSFVYKGRAVDIRQVGRELNVRYVLEGSVRRAGNRLRITAQLVDATSGAHLWADRFDGDVEQIFEVQDEITARVATIVEPAIQAAEIENSRRDRPGSVAAYDLYLHALPLRRANTQPENEEAYALLNKALSIEPGNPTYLAWTSDTLLHRTIMGWPPLTDDDRGAIRTMVNKALLNANEDAIVLSRCGNALIQVLREYDLGLATHRRAVRANPHSVEVMQYAGIGNLHCGDVDLAQQYFANAFRLSPANPFSHVLLTGVAHTHMIRGEWAEALAVSEQSMAANNGFDPTYWMLIAALAHLGRMDDARRWLVRYREQVPGINLERLRAAQPADPSRMGSILTGLEMAGLPEN